MHLSSQDILLLFSFLLLGLAVAFVGVTGFTAWVLTHPYRRTYASAVARGRPGDPSEMRGPDGRPRPFTSWELNWRGLKLPVWDVVGDDPSGPVFILSHGWGDSRIGGLTRLEHLAPLASRLVLWDMPGHGEAPGVCSLGTAEVDALRALIEQLGVPAVLYGWSLGAGVSITAAAREKVKWGAEGQPERQPLGVIAEAPYCLAVTPARNVIAGWGLPHRGTLAAAFCLLATRFRQDCSWRSFDRSVQAAILRRGALSVGNRWLVWHIPLLVIHGECDEVCPVEDGRRIAEAAGGECMVIPGAGHHGIWTNPSTADQCIAAVRLFVAALRRPDSGPEQANLESPHAQQSHG